MEVEDFSKTSINFLNGKSSSTESKRFTRFDKDFASNPAGTRRNFYVLVLCINTTITTGVFHKIYLKTHGDESIEFCILSIKSLICICY